MFYVVALPVALSAPDRNDLLVCGPAIRDENNRTIGSKGLTVPRHAAAANDGPRRFRSLRELWPLLAPSHLERGM